MENFVYEYPTKVCFGRGAAKANLPGILSAYGPNVLLAYGGGSIKKNGVYEEITGILKEAGKNITEFTGIMPNPTWAKVQEGANLARERKIDLVLAVGGGSVVDCCKIVCAQAVTGEDLWDLEMVRHKISSRAPIPLGAVVTASGTGAEMNGGAVITNEDAKIKGGMFAAAPRFAILDPEYTMSLPRMQVLSGAFDTLSHAMETYFGRSDRDNVSDQVALAIMHSTVVNMRTLLRDIQDYTARSNLMWTSAMAENGILKVGRVTDFECHQMEHQLGAYTDCNHGQGLAVLHPAYYRHIVKDAPEKFARLGQVVFGTEGAQAAVDALAAFIKECGLPTRLTELRSRTEITPELLRQVADSVNLLQGGPRQLTHDEVYEIFMECM
ncbi:iron-containing alcohol dehydrogenase [Pseudoflavonifractor capillosus]|uniref:Iron-containing alcohol dehydrogenase n=1 Tax=Pseudoflavonifractor capillosus TaxID=106588 RepID=A0A921MLX6_9FIRM|nr:iron-containing alcohol dehydrogenase [Pseudoflavonifractor capillosus]HJG86560.1 iron-containing alcohol dehydrogenase [Pseudoflavonifractor capillosus]